MTHKILVRLDRRTSDAIDELKERLSLILGKATKVGAVRWALLAHLKATDNK